MREDHYGIPSMADCTGCYYNRVNYSNPERAVISCKHYGVETMGARCAQCHKEFPLGGSVVVITRTKAELEVKHDR